MTTIKMKASCALDPTAIFKRLANGDMQKTAATFEKIRAAEKLKAVQDGAAAAALAKDFAAAAENAAAMNLFVNGVDARAEFVKSEPAFVVTEHTVTTSDIPEMIQLNVLPETDPTTAAPTTTIVVPEVVNPVIYASKLMQVGEGNMHTVSAWSQQGGWWN